MLGFSFGICGLGVCRLEQRLFVATGVVDLKSSQILFTTGDLPLGSAEVRWTAAGELWRPSSCSEYSEEALVFVALGGRGGKFSTARYILEFSFWIGV
jgi:hypothetical protein